MPDNQAWKCNAVKKQNKNEINFFYFLLSNKIFIKTTINDILSRGIKAKGRNIHLWSEMRRKK